VIDPELLEARIQHQLALLRVLAAQTAVEWGHVIEHERYAKSENPLLRALARRMPPPPPVKLR
jgi:hypothetical protein